MEVAAGTHDKTTRRQQISSRQARNHQYSAPMNHPLIDCGAKRNTTSSLQKQSLEAKLKRLNMSTNAKTLKRKLCSTGSLGESLIESRRSSLIKPTPLAWCLLLLVLAIPALLLERLPVATAWNLYDVATHPETTLALEAANLLNLSDSRPSPADPETRPSPLGRILEAAADHALGAANSTSASASSDQSRIGMQLLKPRKSSTASSGASGSKKQVAAAAEQQIINQHSRIHLSGGSHYNHHQRLLPTKQRDQKLVSSLLDSATSDSRDSPLVSLFSGFKSSPITSRSSIVKAISDNKLARTLSSVSKTLGGNKYVAGAAAASALAALGLTVSKFLGPYLLAAPGGGFGKLGEPMLGAGSYLSPVSLASPHYFNTDRNFPTAADSMLVSSTSPHQATPNFISTQQVSPTGLRYSYPEFSYADSSSAASSNYEPSSSSSQLFYPSAGDGAMELASQPQQSISYSQPRQQTFSLTSVPQEQQQQQQLVNKQANDDAINGHYTNFYSSGNEQSYSSQPSTSFMPQNSYVSSDGATRYSSSNFMPSTSSAAADQSQLGELGEATGNYYTYKAYSGEPLMPAASVESPSFSAPAPVATSGQPRRAGTVSLKLDDATRAKLYQQLLRQQQQPPMRIAAQPPVAAQTGHSQQATRPGQVAGVFVPLSSQAPSAEVYRPSSPKSGRAEASARSGAGLYLATTDNLHASPDTGRQQQQQLVGSASQAAGYFILRPNANGQQQQQQQLQAESSRFQSSGEGKPTFGSGWQSLAANKQIDESYLQPQQPQQQQQQQQQQQTNDYDQQVSDSAPRSRVAASGSPVNGREEQVVSVSHRVSRTTPQIQSSVKVGARRPVERLTDYLEDNGNGGLKGLQPLMGSHSTNPVAQHSSSSSSSSSSSASYDSRESQVRSAAEQKSSRQQQANLMATSGSDDARSNLIQLGANGADEDNKNNVIKLIDANTNTMSAKSASSQYDAGLIIMSPPPPQQQQQNRRTTPAAIDEQPTASGNQLATGELAVASQQQAGAIQHHQHHNHADHHQSGGQSSSSSSNNSVSNQAPLQQSWVGTAPLAKAPAQLSAGDFPELRQLTRSLGGSLDFPALD